MIRQPSWQPRRPQGPHPIIVQTWPAAIPDHRSYVHNHYAAKVPISEHDGNPARDLALSVDTPGMLLLEWDIAFDGDDFRAICQAASDNPTEGFVCPYKTWPGPTWGHRIMQGPILDEWWHVNGDHEFRSVTPDDPACNLPCMGAIYIPRDLLEAWKPGPHDDRFTDTNFALWARAQGIWWPIRWDTRPVHVHF